MTDQKKPKDPAPADRRWDNKQGSPKDPGLAKTVERSSSRYSASEQAEKKREKEEGEKDRRAKD